jgi:hypothetical protein
VVVCKVFLKFKTFTNLNIIKEDLGELEAIQVEKSIKREKKL